MMLISSVWAVILWSTSLRSLWPTLMDIPFPFARSLTLSRVLAGSFFFILVLISLLYHDLCFVFEFFFSFYEIDYVIEESWIFSFDLKRSSACMPFCIDGYIYIYIYCGFFWFLSVYSICKFHGKFIYIYICQIPYMWEKRIPVHVITLSLFNNNNNNNNNNGIIPNSMTFIHCGSYFTFAD